MARIIAICNQKGGTGKTTTAINLSTYFSVHGKKVLLIDLDPQGNSTSGLGVEKDNLEYSIYEVLIDKINITDLIRTCYVNTLHLIPSNIDLIAAEVVLNNFSSRERILLGKITPIKNLYDYIIIDCPPSLGLLTLNALVMANSVIIPVQCEYFALEGLGQLVKTINLVRQQFNPDLDIEGVLLTMADFRTNLTAEVLNETRSFFKAKVFQTIIPRSIRLAEAPGFGKPIHFYDQSSIGALKYDALSKEIENNALQKQNQPL